MEEYLRTNRAHWDERAPAHAASPGYALSHFVSDPTYLSDVVRFDLPRLGDIGGLRGVHLQCHIGTDTLSLARLGAQMTGVDFSPASVAQARELAARTGADVKFVECDLYEAPTVLGTDGFDLVFTGVGALCWLPSIRGWAEVVSQLLKPGGRLFIREAHPMLWALEPDREDALLVVDYPYFEADEPLTEETPGTYVETPIEFEANITHSWNHGLGETVTALLNVGMQISSLVEHDSLPWEALPGQMRQVALKEWQLATRPERLPHSFTLQAVKR